MQGTLTEGEGSVMDLCRFYRRLWFRMVYFIVLTSLDQQRFLLSILFMFFYKTITLMRRSTVLSVISETI
jgi:hypothetical protein